MKIAQFKPWIGKEEYESIASCFDINWITEGPLANEFNQQLLQLTGAKYGVFAPNGTLALYLALRSIEVGTEDEVIVPDFTFIGSANAVEMTGATPVFVDVNDRNFQIDISKAEKCITAKTKAIMPVHIYGTVANMDEINRFAAKHGLMVIEDAAQAIGVHYKGKHAGTFGKVGTFSFFADKTITTGEGGFIVTDDEEVYNKLLFLRNQGRINRGTFVHPEIGYNFRMTDIQCAIGLVQLKKLEEIKRRKTILKAAYLDRMKGIEQIKLFSPDKDAEWIPFRIGILCERAHDLMEYMKSKEIETRTFFYPLHQQPCFASIMKKQPFKEEDFANSNYAYEHGVCLPTYPTLTIEEIEYITTNIRDFYARK